MTARVIDGVKLAATIREGVAARSAALAAHGVKPGLAVVLVGSDPASQVYVRNKVTACEKAGMHSVLEQYPTDMTQEALLARIETLNTDPSIHGILVQLPLPKHHSRHTIGEPHLSVERFGGLVVFTHFKINATIAVLGGIIDNSTQQKMSGTNVSKFGCHHKIVNINQWSGLKSGEIGIAVR